MHRPFLFIALAALLLLSLACRSHSNNVFIDPAFISLLPNDAVAIAGARVQAIRATPLYSKVREAGLLDAVDRFPQSVGLDPNVELLELLFVSNGKDTLTMARGKFSPMGMEPRINGPGVSRSNYKGLSIQGTEERSVVFINPTTAVAGPVALLRAVIDQRNVSGHEPQALLDKVKEVPAGSHIWLVAVGPSDLLDRTIPKTGNLANLRRLAGSLQSLVIAADVSRGIDVQAIGECATPKDAQDLSATLQGFLSLMKVATQGKHPELQQVYDAIQLSLQQNVLQAKANWPIDLVDRLLAKTNPSRDPSRD